MKRYEKYMEDILLLTLKSGHGVTGFSVGGYKLFSLVHLIHEITSKDCSENKEKIYKCIRRKTLFSTLYGKSLRSIKYLAHDFLKIHISI